MYAGHMQHHSRTIPVDSKKLLETIFLTVNILNRREIPHCLESHNECILCTARRRYDILTAVAQQINPTYGQTSLRRTDHSHTTKTNLLPSYDMLASYPSYPT